MVGRSGGVPAFRGDLIKEPHTARSGLLILVSVQDKDQGTDVYVCSKTAQCLRLEPVLSNLELLGSWNPRRTRLLDPQSL